MIQEITYKIAEEFSAFPGGRLRENGRYSGQAFREDIAKKLLESYSKVTFDLSSTAGFSSGFLDEAFGGLLDYFTLSELKSKLILVGDDEQDAICIAWKRMKEAAIEKNRL